MANIATLPGSPKTDALTSKSELKKLETGLVAEDPLTQALPVPDMAFGGGVMVLIIMFHAFWIRFITSVFLKRSQAIQARAVPWRADLLFAGTVIALLVLHLAEVMLWTTALVFGDIVGDTAKAGYFAANCYTALGEPFSLPHAWRMVPPIIAISGIFTFAWTASVLVDFVSRYNSLREIILAQRQPSDRQHSP